MAHALHRVASVAFAVVVTLGATYAINLAPEPIENEFAVVAANEGWSRTGEPYVQIDPILEWSKLRLSDMSLDEKVRSLLVLHVPGLDPDAIRSSIASVDSGGRGAGGLILMGNNVPGSAEELAALTAAATVDPELPPIVSIDEEGGDVVRLPYDTFAGADVLRSAPPSDTADAFAGRAQLLESVGVNLNFGIVADVTDDSGSFIYWRTLGDDPASASERVAAGVAAESVVVGSTVKHFPGHGRSNDDSHVGIPTSDVGLDEWHATDALPFKAGIDAGAQAVMFGHLAFSSIDPVPATLSAAWHDILRDELGFDGIAVTDDMLMLQASGVADFADPYVNAVAAVAAGNDALLYVMPTDPATVGIDVSVLASTIGAQVEQSRIDEAALRMLIFRRSFAPDAMNWRPPCDVQCLAGAVGSGISGMPSDALNPQ
jgi:beta-N-acetylhexosaminidase